MIDSIKSLDKELTEIKQAALQSTLKPIPGETLEVCEAQLAALSKTVGLSMAQMLTAAAQGNEVCHFMGYINLEMYEIKTVKGYLFEL